MSVSNEDFAELYRTVAAFVRAYPEDTILIGGIAVYLHTMAAQSALEPEHTRDADAYVSLAAWDEIRAEYEVTSNKRLRKYQIIVSDVEFDLYLEHHNGLRVSWEDLNAAAVTIEGMRVAGLEHLLLLKLAAYRDRAASQHGQKDARDVAKLLVLLADTEPYWTLAQATDADLAALESVFEGGIFMALAKRNAKHAAELKRTARVFVNKLKQSL